MPLPAMDMRWDINESVATMDNRTTTDLVLRLAHPNPPSTTATQPIAKATNRRLKLTDLPVEIVKKIAANCPPRDIFSLSRTSKHMNAICDDVLVFQDSFANHIGRPSLKAIPNKDALLKLIRTRLRAEDPIDARLISVRLATVAAEELTPGAIDSSRFIQHLYWQVVRQNTAHSTISPAVINSVGTLSTFSVLGYPDINSTTATLALVGLNRWILEEDLSTFLRSAEHRAFITQAAFCMGIGTIQHRGCVDPAHAAVLEDHLGHLVGTELSQNMITQDSLEFPQTVGMYIAALLSMDNKTSRPSVKKVMGGGDQIPLPKPRATFDARPSPVRTPAAWTKTAQALKHFGLPDSWAAWLRGGLEALLRDLDKGGWCGHLVTIPSEGSIKTQLDNVKFQKQIPSNEPIRLEAKGDGDGEEVQLTGTITRRNFHCTFTTSTTGPNAKQLEIKGALTPFGICGVSYDLQDNSAHGYMWLYKKSWADAEHDGGDQAMVPQER